MEHVIEVEGGSIVRDGDGYEHYRPSPDTILTMSGIPQIYTKDTTALTGIERYREALSGWNLDSNVLLFGPQGTGKTTIAARLCRQAMMWADKRLEIKWVNWEELTNELKDAMDSGEPQGGITGPVKRSSLSIIDDLAKGTPFIRDDRRWYEMLAYEIINHRYQRGTPTIITTEYSASGLGRYVGKASISRIIESCLLIDLRHQPDFREEEAKRKGAAVVAQGPGRREAK